MIDANLLHNFELDYPEIYYSDVDDIVESDNLELTITTKNGKRYAYDGLTKGLRQLPSKFEDVDDHLFRREFGIRLRRKMMLKGITQRMLSKMIGVSQPAISNYLTGKNSPTLYMAEKLARALECSIQDLYLKY